ncbi:uncharacterized protein LOC127006226 isoform X2 [Eriocheir sinensis]|uniref:uncharacterized protein LOC127006226 isoform X2 n=1 Tax=Eriocheir sinensis TaxID=95602 RepID=UPI0021C73BF0|nr:uncharacterized protein LOC127006226 isoform X2 [Eriocheir sinensis]
MVSVSHCAREAPSGALEAAQAVQVALETPPTVTMEELRPQPDQDSTIVGRLQPISEPSLKAEDLRSLTQPTRSLLQAGRVFAVHQVEGQRRHARISLDAEDERLYLHALKEHTLPLGAATLQVSEIVPPSPPCMVFLDLSWPGCAPRRVHIHLSPNTPRGRQFMLLCTGQCGPSYRDTRLFEVWTDGKMRGCVWGGDYESNDGDGPSVLVPELGVSEYQRSCCAGDVFMDPDAWGRDDQLEFGHFGILTRDWVGCVAWPLVYGKVVEGLHVVAEAAQHSDITEVTVVDCGVVL